jgi:membrane protein CcdC involved in cytochrome C biogenesis
VSQVLHDVSHVLHLRHLFPTAGPARNSTGLLSHCVVVVGEFIMTGLELFAAMAIEIINPLRRVWTAERKVKFRRLHLPRSAASKSASRESDE